MSQGRQVWQEVGDGAARERQTGVRGVRVGEAVGAEDVEADQRLDVSHRAEFAGFDPPQDLSRRAVEEVVVIFDQHAALLPGAANQGVELRERRRGRFLHDDVSPGIERVHGKPVMRGRRRLCPLAPRRRSDRR